MFEYLGTLIGMHQVDGIISSAQAEDSSQKPQVVQMGAPRPAYRILRDQRFEAIRKRFERQLEADKTTPDPHADMWDKDWINKP
jgi:hypothetical protein